MNLIFIKFFFKNLQTSIPHHNKVVKIADHMLLLSLSLAIFQCSSGALQSISFYFKKKEDKKA